MRLHGCSEVHPCHMLYCLNIKYDCSVCISLGTCFWCMLHILLSYNTQFTDKKAEGIGVLIYLCDQNSANNF